jgi:small subunit ribosomal protein S4e
MHIKRKTIPKIWPIAKTGNKYMAVPSHNQQEALPLIIVIRDLLNLVKTKKELKKILSEKKILVNGKIVRETNYPVSLFDSLAIPSIGKYWKIELVDKKLQLSPSTEKDMKSRISKVVNKTKLAGNKIQINLGNGRNIVSDEKLNVGDFVLVDTEKNKITKVIKLEKDTPVIIIKGKHISKSGKIKEIVKEGQNVIAKIKAKEGEISTNIENLSANL